jgi:hypothetical protein
LPSGIIASLSHRAQVSLAAREVALVSASQATGTGNGFVIPGITPLLGNGQPTPHELAREQFRAYFRGPYLIGPGRFSDQARILYIHGTGSSNAFFHGELSLGVATPTDPTAPLTGEAVMTDRNFQGAGIIGLPLTATSVDSSGRPTQLSFVQDPNIYSGIFFVNTAQGTATVHYQPTSPRGGVATVVFSGRVYTSGLTNPLANANLFASGGLK